MRYVRFICPSHAAYPDQQLRSSLSVSGIGTPYFKIEVKGHGHSVAGVDLKICLCMARLFVTAAKPFSVTVWYCVCSVSKLT